MLRTRIFLLSTCLTIGITAVAAHDGATGIVDERMDAMKSMAGDMKALAGMFKEPATFDRERAIEASQTLATHAENIPELFPEGSAHPPSRAAEAIWTDWDDFADDAESLKDAAVAFEARANAGAELAELKPAFDSMASDCQSCHQEFRLPE